MMRWLLLTMIALQAASCGQSGPLVLPERALVAASAAASAAVAGRQR
jgi:predicted small lipoprotein YifL